MTTLSGAGILPSAFRRVVGFATALGLVAGMTGNASAQPETAGAKNAVNTSPVSIATRYPPGAITSLETADAALAAISMERDRINGVYANEERACLPQFVTTACIEDAKERRRQALHQLRPIELESNLFKRRARVAERDQRLEKKQKLQQASQPQAVTSQEKTPQPEAREISFPSTGKAEGASRTGAPDVGRADSPAVRTKRESGEAARSASRRAENVAAYARKVQASRQRQEKIARRKAAKEERRRSTQQPTQKAEASEQQK